MSNNLPEGYEIIDVDPVDVDQLEQTQDVIDEFTNEDDFESPCEDILDLANLIEPQNPQDVAGAFISHPLEAYFDVEPGSTNATFVTHPNIDLDHKSVPSTSQVQVHQVPDVEVEPVLIDNADEITYDNKDTQIDTTLVEITQRALTIADEMSKYIKYEQDGKGKSMLAKATAELLKTATSAVREQRELKSAKDDHNKKIKGGHNQFNNQTNIFVGNSKELNKLTEQIDVEALPFTVPSLDDYINGDA